MLRLNRIEPQCPYREYRCFYISEEIEFMNSNRMEGWVIGLTKENRKRVRHTASVMPYCLRENQMAMDSVQK